MRTTRATTHHGAAKSKSTSQVGTKPRRPVPAGVSATSRQQRRSKVQAAPARESLNGAATLSAEEIHAMVSDAAYLRAEMRNFAPGDELEDWYAAEAEINEWLSRGC